MRSTIYYAKDTSEVKLREVAFDVDYEFTRFRLGWRRLECSWATGSDNTAVIDSMGLGQPPPVSYSLGNNNATAVVAAGAAISNNSTVQRMPVDPDPSYAIV